MLWRSLNISNSFYNFAIILHFLQFRHYTAFSTILQLYRLFYNFAIITAFSIFSIFPFKVAPYSFMTARKLVTNLAENWLIIRKKYDVTCAKMPQNEHKYLAFPLVNISKSLYCSRQRIYLSNSIFSKTSIEQIFLNVKKYHFVTLKKICCIEFLENMKLERPCRYLHLCKF